jgi:uncharacterized protein DUF397
MSTTEPTSMQWRKSSHSNGQANCLEVANVQSDQTTIAIRDSKAKDGRCLILTAQAWRQLINDAKAHVSQ